MIENETGRPVLSGETTLSKAPDDKTEDAYGRNYNGTHVYEMDFAAVTQPGTYRICVEGIGCSYPFEIAEGTWRKEFTVTARHFPGGRARHTIVLRPAPHWRRP